MNVRENNKIQCPSCLSLAVTDTGGRLGEAEDYTPGKSISEPTQPLYWCDTCKEQFILVNYTVCSRCNSKHIKQTGPFAILKREGEPAHRGLTEVYFHCWDCQYDWEDKI